MTCEKGGCLGVAAGIKNRSVVRSRHRESQGEGVGGGTAQNCFRTGFVFDVLSDVGQT